MDKKEAELFTKLLVGLQGVTQLEQPRVSRETIIETLREHTLMLKNVKTEVSGMSSLLKTLANEAADNKRIIQNLQEDGKKTRVDVETLFRTTAGFRMEMDEIGQKLAELLSIRDSVKEQGQKIEVLFEKQDANYAEFGQYTIKTDNAIVELDNKNNETQFQLKELRDYVDHFGDNLILSSTQITVESTAGFSTKPLNLLDVLKKCNGQLVDLEHHLETTTEQVTQNSAKIELKADNTILFNVDILENKVRAIEAHLKREEEQGVNQIRKSCELLTETVETMQLQLSEKVNQQVVDTVVQKKYEDIVRYLRDALEHSAEDESSFRNKAEELQEIVLKLNSSKADRTELSQIQEVLVQTESMISKIGKGGKGGGVGGYSKKELDDILFSKVDKTEIDKYLQSFMKGGGRRKQLQVAASDPIYTGVLPAVEDEVTLSSELSRGYTPTTPNLNMTMTNLVMNSSNPDAIMWKGLADAMKSESENSLLRASASTRISQMTGNSTNDFGSYIKAKKAGKPMTTMSFPSPGSPGAFRSASEGMRPGGDSRPESPGMKTTVTDYPDVTGNTRRNMNYIGSKNIGAGFNVHGGNVDRGIPKPAQIDPDDMEGNNLMIKGKDGKFYHTDAEFLSPNIDPNIIPINTVKKQ